jgi:hypothetical protein
MNMTFVYLMHTVYVAWGGAVPNAYFIHREDCEAYCQQNPKYAQGYERSPQLDDSPWVALMKATPKQDPPKIYVSRRCTLKVPLKGVTC